MNARLPLILACLASFIVVSNAQDLESTLSGATETHRFVVKDNLGNALFMLGGNGKAVFGNIFSDYAKVSIDAGTTLNTGLRVRSDRVDGIAISAQHYGSKGNCFSGILQGEGVGLDIRSFTTSGSSTGAYLETRSPLSVSLDAFNSGGGDAVHAQAKQAGTALYGQNGDPTGWAGRFWGRVNITDRLGIGSMNPEAALHVAGQVKITGGAPGVGKVLTSDADGLATWTTPASGGGLTLPYAETANTPGAAFKISNTSTSTSSHAIIGECADGDCIIGTTAAQKAGIAGSTTNGTGGFGVFGVHHVSGNSGILGMVSAGVVGQAGNASGIGVHGSNSTAATVGSLGSNVAGVHATSGTAIPAIVANATNTSSDAYAIKATSAFGSTVRAENTGGGRALYAMSGGTASTMFVQNYSGGPGAYILELHDGSATKATINRSGDISAAGSVTANGIRTSAILGASATPTVGTAYRDNMILAWGNVSAAGSLSGGFGCTVSKTGTGTYAVTLKNAVASNGDIAISVTPGPSSSVRVATVSSRSTTGCTVQIYAFAGVSFSLTDEEFMFIVTGTP